MVHAPDDEDPLARSDDRLMRGRNLKVYIQIYLGECIFRQIRDLEGPARSHKPEDIRYLDRIASIVGFVHQIVNLVIRLEQVYHNPHEGFLLAEGLPFLVELPRQNLVLDFHPVEVFQQIGYRLLQVFVLLL